jgi:serine/threonine protein phosphatase PrpC
MRGLLASLRDLFLPPHACEISGNSVTGAGREHNEDSVGFVQDELGGIAILADGVGGHNAGEVASRYLCTELQTWFSSRSRAPNAQQAAEQLRAAITRIHEALYLQSQQQAELAGMASTLTVVLLYKRNAVYAWAGDSRIYLLRDQQLSQLSEDHSVVEDRIRQGELTRAEAAQHPLAHLITSSIGNKPRIPRLGMKTIELAKNDILLLVSDGISGSLSSAQLAELASKDADALISAAQAAQSTDDCSAVIVRVKGD